VSRVQEIAEQMRALLIAEFFELRVWLNEYEDQLWDEAFQAEVATGKWNSLAEKSLRNHREGKSITI
jgi:hypothetical protein